MFVVLVKARCRRGDGVVLKEAGGAASVFSRDNSSLTEHPEGPQRVILQVADWSGDHVEDARHVWRADCNACIQPNLFPTLLTNTSPTCTKFIRRTPRSMVCICTTTSSRT